MVDRWLIDCPSMVDRLSIDCRLLPAKVHLVRLTTRGSCGGSRGLWGVQLNPPLAHSLVWKIPIWMFTFAQKYLSGNLRTPARTPLHRILDPPQGSYINWTSSTYLFVSLVLLNIWFMIQGDLSLLLNVLIMNIFYGFSKFQFSAVGFTFEGDPVPYFHLFCLE